MSAPIGPGDYVECVNNGPIRNSNGLTYDAAELKVGAIYTVVSITANDGVHLKEVQVSAMFHDSGYRTSRFRPIYRRSDKILKSVLLPVDEEAHA